MKLLGTISVDFDVTDQLLITFFAFVKYCKKWEYSETVHQQFIDFKKAYDSVRKEVLYNILIELSTRLHDGTSTGKIAAFKLHIPLNNKTLRVPRQNRLPASFAIALRGEEGCSDVT
jgi:hypothetical protein